MTTNRGSDSSSIHSRHVDNLRGDSRYVDNLYVDSSTLPDRVRVLPGRLAGEVRVPGDKSLSHRALILGALATGPVAVSGLATSQDVRSTASALARLGADVDLRDETGGLSGRIAGPLREPADVLDCGNSGTALRLLAGVAAGLDGLSVLSGDASLRTRPVDRVMLPLGRMGARVDARAGGRLPPLAIRGGSLRPIVFESPVPSAQVKSAVLLAALHAGGPCEVISRLRSRDHTERLMRHLGVDVETQARPDGSERVVIFPGTLNARSLQVLGDPSSAAFWMVAAAPALDQDAERDAVTLPGLCLNPTRLGAVEVLRAMGAHVEVAVEGEVAGEPVGTVRVGPSRLTGAVVQGGAVVDAIDELPILAVAGACASQGLEVRDATELRVKESDRIAGVVSMLRTLGVRANERPDGFSVPGGRRLTGGVVQSGGDHRIAMAACIAGTVAAAPVEVDGFAVVATSYPTFLEDFRALGGTIEVLDHASAPPAR